MSLFDRLGLRDGTICLDVGCGGGDATLELARRVAPTGRVVGVAVAQPVGTEGEVKLLNPLTMENIASAVLADGLASQHEIDEVVRELYEFATDPNTVAGTPRVVQAWGRRPTA
jgi:cyclopropane fatty-acyl-phospholipid synthase-like methyltransferase